MSRRVFTPEIAELGERHFGRRGKQPTREQLRAFYREAERRLAHRVLWFDDAERQALSHAVLEVVDGEGLTCYAFAALRNHVHLLIRRHRIRAREMSVMLKEAARTTLALRGLAPEGHPIFSADCCHLFKTTLRSVRTCVTYIHDNYRKHRLDPITVAFVTPYDNWPFRNRSS